VRKGPNGRESSEKRLRRDRHRLGELFKRLPPLRKTAKESDVKKSLFMSKIGWRANVNPRASECIPTGIKTM
jgi:hypothetical protein